MKQTLQAILTTGVISVIFLISCFYFRLGPVLGVLYPLVLIFCVWISSTITNEWVSPSFLIAPFFCLFNFALWSVVTREQTFTEPMTWQPGGQSAWQGETGVTLSFIRFPEDNITVFSKNLAKYLSEQNLSQFEVKFLITKDFGCVRGTPTLEIANQQIYLQHWGRLLNNKENPVQNWTHEPDWCS